MPKRTPKSLNCHPFAKKGEMLQTVCFPRENVVLGIQQLKNMYTEIIENGCQGKLGKQIGKLY